MWTVVAFVLGAGIVFLNRAALPRLGLNSRRASFWLGLVAELSVVNSSIAGAMRFAAEKPFI
jgi:hypothetical protein